jgi:hypothetical protein
VLVHVFVAMGGMRMHVFVAMGGMRMHVARLG